MSREKQAVRASSLTLLKEQPSGKDGHLQVLASTMPKIALVSEREARSSVGELSSVFPYLMPPLENRGPDVRNQSSPTNEPTVLKSGLTAEVRPAHQPAAPLRKRNETPAARCPSSVIAHLVLCNHAYHLYAAVET